MLGRANINVQEAVYGFIQGTVLVNIGLGVFNLIPLYPLDGSKVLNAFLPTKADMWLKSNQQYVYLIFIFIWVTGIAERLISPAIVSIYNLIIKGVFFIFGI